MRSIEQVRDEVQKANQRVLKLAGEGEQRSGGCWSGEPRKGRYLT